MRALRIACLLLLIGASVALTGCGNRSSRLTVVFISNNPETFWDYAQAGCDAAGEELDVDVEFRRPPNASPSDQKQIIDALLNKGVKAIAISVIDPETQSDYLQQVAKRVPLIAVDNDAPDSGRKCYLGTDNIKAGRSVGELVKKALPDGGTFAVFVGQMEARNAQERLQGVLNELAGAKEGENVKQGLEKYGKYKLFSSGAPHGVFTDGQDRGKAKDNATNVLNRNEDEEKLCLIGLWAYNPPAIYAAVKTAKRTGQVKMVAFDEEQETLDGVEAGHIEGTVVQQPYKFGYEAVKMMTALARGESVDIPADGIIPIDHKVITKEKVQEFRDELVKLKPQK